MAPAVFNDSVQVLVYIATSYAIQILYDALLVK